MEKNSSPTSRSERQIDNDFLGGRRHPYPTLQAEGAASMFRAFTEHPETVGETYFEHMGQASWFAMNMAIAAFCCAVHAVLPFAFEKTGSQRIRLLYDRMVTNRHRAASRSAEPQGFVGYAEGI